jgi:hypothetical protein
MQGTSSSVSDATAGMDGFYDRRSCQGAAGNPSSWAGYTGQDFLPQHAVPAIDFAAIHLWPDNWKRTDQDFGPTWLNIHSKNGGQLGKPVVLEEFGKVRPHRGQHLLYFYNDDHQVTELATCSLGQYGIHVRVWHSHQDGQHHSNCQPAARLPDVEMTCTSQRSRRAPAWVCHWPLIFGTLILQPSSDATPCPRHHEVEGHMGQGPPVFEGVRIPAAAALHFGSASGWAIS